MQINKATKVSAAILLPIIVCLLLLYIRRDTVVLAHVGGSDVYDHHNRELLNPFRDRAPERTAETFLQNLRDHCETTLSAIGEKADRMKYTCEVEHSNQMNRWKLQAWKQESPFVLVLRYNVSRSASESSGKESRGPFWIWLKKSATEWHVTGYEAWY